MMLEPILNVAPRGLVIRSKRLLYRQIPYRISQLLDQMARPAAVPAARKRAETARHFGCIFVHIPKTAGMSVGRSLFGGGQFGSHHAVRDYMMVLPRQEFQRLFKFCIVRNPWDRVHSAYRFLSEGGLNARDRAWAARELAGVADFTDFVMNRLGSDSVMRSLHFLPQLHWMSDPGGQVVMDMVGRYERLADDYALIRQRLGFGDDLQWINRTPGEARHYREAYDEHSAAIVYDLYRPEIDHFGYGF